MQYPHIIQYVDKCGSKKRILDVGCGEGQLARLLARKSFTIGIDLYNDGYKLPEGKTGKLYFLRANGLQLPFISASFDAVVVSNVLQMVQDDGGLLNECRRVMKASGVLLLTVPVGYVWIPFLFSKGNLCAFLRHMFLLPEQYEQFKSLLNIKHGAQGRGYYSLSELYGCLERSGFTINNKEFAPRALGTFLYEISLISRWVLRANLSVAGYLNMILYPIGWIDRFLPATFKGCECLVVCCKTRAMQRL
jgi:SAM-dependent methyltransferase